MGSPVTRVSQMREPQPAGGGGLLGTAGRVVALPPASRLCPRPRARRTGASKAWWWTSSASRSATPASPSRGFATTSPQVSSSPAGRGGRGLCQRSPCPQAPRGAGRGRRGPGSGVLGCVPAASGLGPGCPWSSTCPGRQEVTVLAGADLEDGGRRPQSVSRPFASWSSCPVRGRPAGVGSRCPRGRHSRFSGYDDTWRRGFLAQKGEGRPACVLGVEGARSVTTASEGQVAPEQGPQGRQEPDRARQRGAARAVQRQV